MAENKNNTDVSPRSDAAEVSDALRGMLELDLFTSEDEGSNPEVEALKCRICKQFSEDNVSVICGHWFCARCLQKYFSHTQQIPRMCPVCRYAILEEKDLCYVDRRLAVPCEKRFYESLIKKYGDYSDFPEGDWDKWSSMMDDEDDQSVKSLLDEISDTCLIPIDF